MLGSQVLEQIQCLTLKNSYFKNIFKIGDPISTLNRMKSFMLNVYVKCETVKSRGKK